MNNRIPENPHTIARQFIAAGALLLTTATTTAFGQIPTPDPYELPSDGLPLTRVVRPHRPPTFEEAKAWMTDRLPTSPAGMARTEAQKKMAAIAPGSGKKECILVYTDKDKTQMMDGMYPFLLDRETAHYTAAACTPPGPLMGAAYFCGKKAEEQFRHRGPQQLGPLPPFSPR